MSDEISFNRAMTFEYGKPSEMVPGVDRIVANNPGPFTFKGTNTYLIGSEALAVVDPGHPRASQPRRWIGATSGGD